MAFGNFRLRQITDQNTKDIGFLESQGFTDFGIDNIMSSYDQQFVAPRENSLIGQFELLKKDSEGQATVINNIQTKIIDFDGYKTGVGSSTDDPYAEGEAAAETDTQSPYNEGSRKDSLFKFGKLTGFIDSNTFTTRFQQSADGIDTEVEAETSESRIFGRLNFMNMPIGENGLGLGIGTRISEFFPVLGQKIIDMKTKLLGFIDNFSDRLHSIDGHGGFLKSLTGGMFNGQTTAIIKVYKRVTDPATVDTMTVNSDQYVHIEYLDFKPGKKIVNRYVKVYNMSKEDATITIDITEVFENTDPEISQPGIKGVIIKKGEAYGGSEAAPDGWIGWPVVEFIDFGEDERIIPKMIAALQDIKQDIADFFGLDATSRPVLGRTFSDGSSISTEKFTPNESKNDGLFKRMREFQESWRAPIAVAATIDSSMLGDLAAFQGNWSTWSTWAVGDGPLPEWLSANRPDISSNGNIRRIPGESGKVLYTYTINGSEDTSMGKNIPILGFGLAAYDITMDLREFDVGWGEAIERARIMIGEAIRIRGDKMIQSVLDTISEIGDFLTNLWIDVVDLLLIPLNYILAKFGLGEIEAGRVINMVPRLSKLTGGERVSLLQRIPQVSRPHPLKNR